MEPDTMQQILLPPAPPEGYGSQILFPPTLPPGNGSVDKWPDNQFQENMIQYLETVCHQVMSLVEEMRRRGNERSATCNNSPYEYHQSTSTSGFTQDDQLKNKLYESKEPSQLTEHETEFKLPSFDSKMVEDDNYKSEQKDRCCLSKAIQMNFTRLVEVLPYRESELPDILGELCLTDNENSRIRNQPHREDQVRQLLRTIMGRTFRVMKDFLDYAIKFNRQDVEIVWKTFDELKREGLEEKRCVLCRIMAYVDIKYVADALYERDLVPHSFHGRVSDSMESVGCQDTLWNELASLFKRTKYSYSMLTALSNALGKKQKYFHFGEELQRYVKQSLTVLKCTCQTNYRNGNRGSSNLRKQNKEPFCQRVESFRSSSGTTSISPRSSNSDLTRTGPSTRLRGRCRIARLSRTSSFRLRPLPQFSRRGPIVKTKRYKPHLNLDDEAKEKESESMDNYIKDHNTGIRAQSTLKPFHRNTQNKLSGLRWTSELQSLDEERQINEPVLFNTRLEEAISSEHAHSYDANSSYDGKEERFENDLPETIQKMLPTFLKDVWQFSGEDTPLTRSHSTPLSLTRPFQFSHIKSNLLNDNNLSRKTPAIYNSDLDDNQGELQGANIHTVNKTGKNEESLIQPEISEDNNRKVIHEYSEENSVFQNNVTDLFDSKDNSMRLDGGTNENKNNFHNHIIKGRLTTISLASSQSECDFAETENNVDEKMSLLSERGLEANKQACERDNYCINDEIGVEERDERNTLPINTRHIDKHQYGIMFTSKQQIENDIMKYSIEQNNITTKALHKEGQANETADMNNQEEDIGQKEQMPLGSMFGSSQETNVSVLKTSALLHSKNTASQEPLSYGQLRKTRSESNWRRFRSLLRSKKKEKVKQ